MYAKGDNGKFGKRIHDAPNRLFKYSASVLSMRLTLSLTARLVQIKASHGCTGVVKSCAIASIALVDAVVWVIPQILHEARQI